MENVCKDSFIIEYVGEVCSLCFPSSFIMLPFSFGSKCHSYKALKQFLLNEIPAGVEYTGL
jgi:hypothetical protein